MDLSKAVRKQSDQHLMLDQDRDKMVESRVQSLAGADFQEKSVKRGNSPLSREDDMKDSPPPKVTLITATQA